MDAPQARGDTKKRRFLRQLRDRGDLSPAQPLARRALQLGERGLRPGGEIALLCAEPLQKRFVLDDEFRFESLGAITIATSPRLRSVFVPAVSARVRVLNAEEVEIYFPIGPFFRQRRIAKTDLDPSRNSVFVDAGLLHIMEVFVPGDRTATEGAVINCAKERVFFFQILIWP
jgi:hypothetical protein